MRKIYWMIPILLCVFVAGVWLSDPLLNLANAIAGKAVFSTRDGLRKEIRALEEERNTLRSDLDDGREGLQRLASELNSRDYRRLTREALLGATDEQGKSKIMLRPAETEMMLSAVDRDSAALGAVRKAVSNKISEMLEVSRRILGEKVARLNLELREMNTSLQERNMALQKNIAELDEYRNLLETQKAYIGELEGVKQELLTAVSDLETEIKDGRLKVSFQGDILFASGRHDLRVPGRKLLDSIFPILSSQQERFDIFVAGHTDNVPIRADALDRYRSNWELSTYRAIEVVRYLTAKGLEPRHLTAAGYGEYKPLVANTNPTNRQRNRRVELFLIPKVIQRGTEAERPVPDGDRGNAE